jgi:hypothetical protein
MRVRSVSILCFLLFCFSVDHVCAQSNKNKIDSLYNAYLHEKTDTGKVNKQEELFLNIFNEWKGPLSQVDDVLLFGVKI